MDYINKLQNVTVLGAAGKMGSGILLLTAMEMADQKLKAENKGKLFVLNAMDVSNEALFGLMQYIRAQVLKAAEKKTVMLRKVYEDRNDLVENSEIERAIVLEHSLIRDIPARVQDSLIGRHVSLVRSPMKPQAYTLTLGDHSQVGIL